MPLTPEQLRAQEHFMQTQLRSEKDRQEFLRKGEDERKKLWEMAAADAHAKMLRGER